MIQLLAGLTVILTIGYTMFTLSEGTQKAIGIYHQAKQILSLDDKRTVQLKTTGKVIQNIKDVKNLKLSSLAILPSTQDKILLDKLQKATRIAIVDDRIENPTCSDLASTNAITLDECNNIAFKTQDYLQIDDSVIKIPNNSLGNKIANSLSVMTKTQRSKDDTTLQFSLLKNDRKTKEANFNTVVKATKQAEAFVDVSDNIEIDNLLLQKVINNSPKAPVKSLNIAKRITRKIEAKTVPSTSSSTSTTQTDQNDLSADSAINILDTYVQNIATVNNNQADASSRQQSSNDATTSGSSSNTEEAHATDTHVLEDTANTLETIKLTRR